MGQEMPGRNVSGESLVARRRVKERRGGLNHSRETEGAGSTAFVIRVGLRLVMLALRRGPLHLGAAIGLGYFGPRHLAG
jgi:hypothetical protein